MVRIFSNSYFDFLNKIALSWRHYFMTHDVIDNVARVCFISLLIFVSSETAKQNSTKLDIKQELKKKKHPLPNLCFSGRLEKQGGRPCLWLVETFSTSPLKPLNVIQRNLSGSKISTSSTKFVVFFSGRSEKQDGRPALWLAETFSTYPLKPLNRIQPNLTGS